jgi:NADH-quinone oxidoreductase subunit E
MTVTTIDQELILGTVREAVECIGNSRSELIPILSQVNDKLGYLPEEALDEVSKLLYVPKSRVFSVATFYNMLITKPRGKHVVQFCESAPCHVAGGRDVWKALQESLGIKSGETTSDGNFTLVTTSCLGVCGVGPVIIIDDEIFGNVEPNKIPDILARYR